MKPKRQLVSKKALLRAGLFLLIVGSVFIYVKNHWQDFAFHVFRQDDSLAALSAGGPDSGDDFLIELRLDKEKTQKSQLDYLKEIIDDKEASREIRDAAYRQYLVIVDYMGKERKIEEILSAKGFESVAVISQDTCTVIIRKTVLDQKDVSQVGDVVRRVAGVRPENLSIIPTDR